MMEQSIGENQDARSQPVTVVVRRTIQQGKEKNFEEWLKGATADLKKFPGYMDITLIRPPVGAPKLEYVLLIHFDNYDHLDAWENSAVRNEWMAKAKEWTVNLENQRITGLEFWFSLPEMPKALVPPRYKMAIVTALAIFPLSTLMNIFVLPRLSGLPFLLRGVVITILLVVIMTYIVMPYMVRIFKKWLFKRT